MKNFFFLVAILMIAACQTEPSINKTPSGFEYTHHIKNNGATPQSGEEVEFVVDMRNGDKIINSSRQQGQPARFLIPNAEQPNNSISAIVEGLQIMSVGDSITIKQSLDSFPRKPPGFEDAQFIAFDMVLLDIVSKEEIEKKRAEQMEQMKIAQARETEVADLTQDLLKKYKGKQLGKDLKSTTSGLKYYVIEEGSGDQVTNGRLTNVHYYGVTTDGNMFDNSFKRGAPYPVPVGRGQVIRGWDEGLQLFKVGTKAVLFIPGELGYGATGSPPNIGPNAELVFYVELAE